MCCASTENILSATMPVIISGGILSGGCTATESSVIAVMYGATLSMFIYRELHLRDLGGLLVTTAKLTGVCALVLGMYATFTWIAAELDRLVYEKVQRV